MQIAGNGFECGSWNSNLKWYLSTAALLENCQKSHYLGQNRVFRPLLIFLCYYFLPKLNRNTKMSKMKKMKKMLQSSSMFSLLEYTSILRLLFYVLGLQLLQPTHSTYSWDIKCQKCARIGLNSFHVKWIIGIHCNWKNQNPGSRFGATS